MSLRPGRPGALAYVGSWLFAAWMFGSAIVLGFGGLPVMFGPRRWAAALIQLWARGSLRALGVLVGGRVEVRGRERLPQGGYLVAAKHQSMLDVLIVITLTPWPCIVLKRELMWVPIFGWYSWKSGMIAIDREGGAPALRVMLDAARKALADGRQVVIYPEGTRRDPGAPPAYKGGTGRLYTELGAPCVLLATHGGEVWPAHGMVKHPGVARFEVLPPIQPGLPRRAFMARLERELEAGSAALAAEE